MRNFCYDTGKKVSGIRGHIAAGTNGLSYAVHVRTAEVTGKSGAIHMFEILRDGLSLMEKVLCDEGYSGENFARSVKDILDAEVETGKRNELHGFAVLSGRWVVERTFGWIEKCEGCGRIVKGS